MFFLDLDRFFSITILKDRFWFFHPKKEGIRFPRYIYIYYMCISMDFSISISISISISSVNVLDYSEMSLT